jgi:SAM-dependent methyltransferase
MRTQALFERYYYSRPTYVGGTKPFHQICQAHIADGEHILEIGAGPANPTTAFLSSLGSVTGADISPEVLDNPNVATARVYDGIRLPFPDNSFDLCVSNYVLEHVVDPLSHFQEVFRVLQPGAAYCFRTPNRWHYVTMAASLMPHSMHLRLANKLRALDADAHDPWPTVYRANTRNKLRLWARRSSLLPVELRMIEAEPSYGAAHPLLFYPMMAYERLVNSSDLFSLFRVNILGTFRKPSSPAASA